jgi:hypothetical protein
VGRGQVRGVETFCQEFDSVKVTETDCSVPGARTESAEEGLGPLAGRDKVLRELERIEQYLRGADPQSAETGFIDLINGLSDHDFLYYHPDFINLLDSPGFAQRSKKRRKNCLEKLRAREVSISEPEGAQPGNTQGAVIAFDPHLIGDIDTHLRRLSRVLEVVYEKHIFQWDSYESLGLFEALSQLASLNTDADDWSMIITSVEEAFYEHSRGIFKKGFDEQVRKGRSQTATSSKALGGLRSFTEVIISNQAYLTGSTLRDTPVSARVRTARLCQAALAGIVGGFCALKASAGALRVDGQQLIAESDPFVWGHAFAYMNAANLSQILSEMEDLQGLDPDPLVCLLQGMEKAASSSGIFMPLLDEVTVDRAASGMWPITLRYRSLANQKYENLRLRVTLSDGAVSSETARAPIHRENCALSVAVVNPETYAAIRSEVVGYERVVAAGGIDRLASERARTCIELAIGDLVRASQRDLPLEINFAENFPLDRDDQVRLHYLVSRIGVLDRTVKLGHGAYLWCSVRRSGKSTAAYYMTRSEGNVAWQTFRPERNEDMVLKQELERAVGRGDLPQDFVTRIVTYASDGTGSPDGARVLVIDEYEQLFSYLMAVAEDAAVRQNVVIPFINQLLEFSLENILIMLGLVPNAHYILMDQNHLAPSVRASPFPLFAFSEEPGASEFVELLEKVLTPQVTFDHRFASSIYGETRGHPYLTVELMRHFMAFQIGNRRRRSTLDFGQEDFDEFRQARFSPRKFALEERNYAFHRSALKEAISLGSRAGLSASDQWIHYVSWILRAVSEGSSASLNPAEMRIDLDALEARALLEMPDIATPGLYNLLREASLANFVSYDDNQAWPTIPLLGRLATAK